MFSLSSFIFVIKRSINNIKRNWENSLINNDNEDQEVPETRPELTDDELETRIKNLVDMITSVSWDFLRRGLFDKHKVVVIAIMCFRIKVKNNDIPREQ